jgi:hypothetical protein
MTHVDARDSELERQPDGDWRREGAPLPTNFGRDYRQRRRLTAAAPRLPSQAQDDEPPFADEGGL